MIFGGSISAVAIAWGETQNYGSGYARRQENKPFELEF
jgi:hypothetical protein